MPERTWDRRRFLRELGKTAAVGVGLVAVPTQALGSERTNRTAGANTLAVLTTFECCTAPRFCGECDGSQVKYRCRVVSGQSCPSYCTRCKDYQGDCYTFTTDQC